MLQWFQRLMPRQDVFFPAFERHAAVIVKAAMALRQMVLDGDQLKLRFSKKFWHSSTKPTALPAMSLLDYAQRLLRRLTASTFEGDWGFFCDGRLAHAPCRPRCGRSHLRFSQRCA